MIDPILHKDRISKEDIVVLLNAKGNDQISLLNKSAEIRKKYVGHEVYLRGLIELSNICAKDCYYCGIRKSNAGINRYNITDEEILQAARFACENNWGSLVLQSGEIQGESFVKRIEALVEKIRKISDNKLMVTLSCGEQSQEVYQKWFNAGAQRYLLRMETSSKKLYKRLHPDNELHNWENRLKCLHLLKESGFQTGTGVMIGLPFQSIDDLADDLLFMRDLDIDMCGMGPYIAHAETPLYEYKSMLLPLQERFDLSMKMVAVLRLLMKDINIAATTAHESIDPLGKEKIIGAGANVIMPNITPGRYHQDYYLYPNKSRINHIDLSCIKALEAQGNYSIAYGKWGNSLHFSKKKQS